MSSIVGTALVSKGNQVVTSVLITSAVDCYPEEAGSIRCSSRSAADLGVLGPFWFVPISTKSRPALWVVGPGDVKPR